VGLNFGLAAPAWRAIEDARAAPADLTRTEADQLSRSFNVARGLTLGVGVAGLGLGATGLSLQLSERTSLSPALGSAALTVLAVIILGGLDSIAGAIVAGLIVGLLESLTAGYLGGKVRDIVPYVVVLVILLIRPYGLFGTRQIERL
jgi:branched-subunit amino acid ABC-type transport system permease component